MQFTRKRCPAFTKRHRLLDQHLPGQLQLPVQGGQHRYEREVGLVVDADRKLSHFLV